MLVGCVFRTLDTHSVSKTGTCAMGYICDRYQTREFLEEWRASRSWLCLNKRVEELAYPNFQYEPRIRVFYNVTMNSIDGNIYAPCPFSKRTNKWNREWQGRKPTRVVDTVYRVCRFDVYNPYEAFGAYLNAFIAFRILNLSRDTHIVLTDLHGNRGNFDSDIWSSLSAHPIVYRSSHSRSTFAPLIARRVIKSANSAASIIYTYSRDGVFKGRERSHKCFSSYVHNAVAWLRMAFHVSLEKHPTSVLWIVRKKNPRVRGLRRAAQKIQALQSRWNLQSVDPEELPTRDVIKIFTGARYAFAPHGGGNAWIAFMQARTCFLELFGGDRNRINRHYDNIATLVGLIYHEHSPLRSFCDDACVQKIIHVGEGCTTRKESS